jgi:ubiquinone/menaquinone biosynthesis C-methylase UbiE
MDLGVRPRRARIAAVDRQVLTLEPENLDADRPQLHLNLTMGEARYFFAASPLPDRSGSNLRVKLPSVIYRSERRDIPRRSGREAPVELFTATGNRASGVLIDQSYEGLGVRVAHDFKLPIGETLKVRVADGNDSESYATVRHSVPKDGWQKLGLAISQVAPSEPVRIETRNQILERSAPEQAWARIHLAGKALATAPRIFAERNHLLRPRAPTVEVLEYCNDRGETLKAILNDSGGSEGAPIVVIPPAWGRTKETLLPLAETIVSTFRAAGEGIKVLRYDERNRRGESYIDPASSEEGAEGLHYTFSGAVEDIHTTLRFIQRTPRLATNKVLLVTVSLASIQGRRAVATDPTGLVVGWVSLVGMPDLQSSMRAVTGGIDWVYGLSQGVSFGRQELVGVLVDMDIAGPDTLRHRLGYFEDARRDMAKIKVPITWIYGKHDGWMSLDRVQELMSAGGTSQRRLIEVPTGHQLRNSREALETFQLVTEEASRVLLGRRLTPRVPNLLELDRRRAAERSRRPRASFDRRRFWHDYLLGRDETIGMELMGATSLYKAFLDDQLDCLKLQPGSRLLDVGAGTGELAVRLGERGETDLELTAIDLVHPALLRARARLEKTPLSRVTWIVADLNGPASAGIPIASCEFDAVAASLLVSYLKSPDALLRQVRGLIRRGGRIVVSAPKRDADISKLFSDTLPERDWDRIADLFGETVAARFEFHQAEFLNNAAKVLEFEEDGRFRFYDPSELEGLLKKAGFRDVSSQLSFGSPGQFSIAWGIR